MILILADVNQNDGIHPTSGCCKYWTFKFELILTKAYFWISQAAVNTLPESLFHLFLHISYNFSNL